MKRRNMKGFTLVELLIVLLILGILIGLAVPRYLQAVEASKERTFCANIRNILSALETYRMDNNTTQYPTDLNTAIINSATYFSQKPVNPFNNTVMTDGNGYDYLTASPYMTYTLTITQTKANGDTVNCNLGGTTQTGTTP